MVTVFDKFSKKVSFQKLILPLEMISVQIGKPRSKTPPSLVHGWFFFQFYQMRLFELFSDIMKHCLSTWKIPHEED